MCCAPAQTFMSNLSLFVFSGCFEVIFWHKRIKFEVKIIMRSKVMNAFLQKVWKRNGIGEQYHDEAEDLMVQILLLQLCQFVQLPNQSSRWILLQFMNIGTITFLTLSQPCYSAFLTLHSSNTFSPVITETVYATEPRCILRSERQRLLARSNYKRARRSARASCTGRTREVGQTAAFSRVHFASFAVN